MLVVGGNTSSCTGAGGFNGLIELNEFGNESEDGRSGFGWRGPTAVEGCESDESGFLNRGIRSSATSESSESPA